MGQRHKHADVIIAWANGEEVEGLGFDECWYPVTGNFPTWHENVVFRIKPKTMKREGWVNVYPSEVPLFVGALSHAYATREDAEEFSRKHVTLPKRIACIRIEWEEEEPCTKPNP